MNIKKILIKIKKIVFGFNILVVFFSLKAEKLYKWRKCYPRGIKKNKIVCFK